MTVPAHKSPAPAAPSAGLPAALPFRPEPPETAIASDLGALRTIIRHLDILAEDYAADFDLRNSLRRAARWAAHARDALQKRTPQEPHP